MTSTKRRLLVGIPLVLLIAGGAFVAHKYNQLDGQEANKHRVFETATGGKPHYEPIQYRAKDARPAISKPEFVAADEAPMAGGVKGIGVSIKGDHRFYPLFVMQYHQIVNDNCGDTAIACTY